MKHNLIWQISVIALILLGLLSGCLKDNTDSEILPTTTIPAVEPSPTAEPTSIPTPIPTPQMSDEERFAHIAMGRDLEQEARISGFGGTGIEDMISTFGEPDRIVSFEGIQRWYYDDEGFEIDYTTLTDGLDPMFENYIYLGPNCKVDFCRGIIPGSTREELEAAYKEEIDRYSSTADIVCAGYYCSSGLIFVMKDDEVDSIYINTDRRASRYSGEFVPDR